MEVGSLIFKDTTKLPLSEKIKKNKYIYNKDTWNYFLHECESS